MKPEQFKRADKLVNEVSLLANKKDAAKAASELNIRFNYSNEIYFENGSTFGFSCSTNLTTGSAKVVIEEIMNEELQDCLASIARRLEKEIAKREKEFEKL